MSLHIHLDPVGGVAGDMFVAALLDSWPAFTADTIQAVRDAGLGHEIKIAHRAHSDGILTGSLFTVSHNSEKEPHSHSHDHGHHHTSWKDIRAQLETSDLDDRIKDHAIGIFGELAIAEASVHGKPVDAVTFHEVGNWDSIADIVAAAALIHFLNAKSWSIGSLPIGRGLVKTAHGELPVPAPATTLLLKGFAFHDDGRPGERVTPTGAAILKYLAPNHSIAPSRTILQHTGFGFGTRKLKGMSNVLRVLGFEEPADQLQNQDMIGVIQFELDDQTGEELAVALDIIRAEDGVLDVIQTPMMGKKGRLVHGVQVLTKTDQLEQVSDACFRQTTTLGVRTRFETRKILKRQETTLASGEHVKRAQRPGGDTVKTDIEGVKMDHSSHLSRQKRRNAAESTALAMGWVKD